MARGLFSRLLMYECTTNPLTILIMTLLNHTKIPKKPFASNSIYSADQKAQSPVRSDGGEKFVPVY